MSNECPLSNRILVGDDTIISPKDCEDAGCPHADKGKCTPALVAVDFRLRRQAGEGKTEWTGPNDPIKAGSLFREDGRMTQEGLDIDSRVNEQLAGYFTAHRYPQEVAAILHATIEELRCETVLNRDSKCVYQQQTDDTPSQSLCKHPSKTDGWCDFVGNEARCPARHGKQEKTK
jgi:hypothetical protein